MPSNEQLITQFYDALSRKDGDAMAACYHDDVRFSDPVFTSLRGRDAGDMWRMLTARGKDLTVSASNIRANDTSGSATWVATYSFGPARRKVENHITASFKFKTGKIIDHRDVFDLYAWTRMALGLPGTLMGWTPFMQNKVRAQAMGGLRAFQKK